MTIDAWDPKTFGTEISAVLTNHSDLIFDYHLENRRLMDEHLHSSPYQSLMPNRFYPHYHNFHENILAPIIARSRIRAWHYTRITDEEAEAMRHQLKPSSLDYLRFRLDNLVAKNLLTQEDAETVFDISPFHQQPIRAGCLCTTIIPLSHRDSGVKLLLENWGGESAYFWLNNAKVAERLKNIGTSRIIEIETALTDHLNGYRVSSTFLAAWAHKLGAPVTLSECDLFIRECVNTAKVLRIHSKGDMSFETVRRTYPAGISTLLKNDYETNT